MHLASSEGDENWSGISFDRAAGLQFGCGNIQVNHFHDSRPTADFGGTAHHPPLRVYVSHTSEFSTFPPTGSFTGAVIEAINDCGHVPVEMRSFVAESAPSAEVCERIVRTTDIFIGVLGHRYGTRLNDRDISFAEFEYECAVTDGIPQLMFLLSADAVVPLRSFADWEGGPRQDLFRALVKSRPVSEFSTPEDLKYKVSRALADEVSRINAIRSPARPARDQLRFILDEIVPKVSWCSEYLAMLALDQRPEIPVTLNGAVVFVAIDVGYELIPDWRGNLRDSWPRIRSLLSGRVEEGVLRSCVTAHRDTFLVMADYLATQHQMSPSIRDKINVIVHSPRSEIATAYHRPQARALLDALWNEEDWPELERQASRWTDSRDPVLRGRARNALLAAVEAGGRAQATRAALIAAGFTEAPDAECIDYIRAAVYAAAAGDLDTARRFVRFARNRWKDDEDAKRLEFQLGRYDGGTVGLSGR